MQLQRILLCVENKVYSFKTIPDVEGEFNCSIPTKIEEELIYSSLTNKICYGKITNGQLTITKIKEFSKQFSS